MVRKIDPRREGDTSGEPPNRNRRTVLQSVGTGFVAATIFPTAKADVSTMDANPESDPWRPEYHFAPSTGWMNDPNGLIYHDGVYHLFYQAGERRRRWDHATSSDLVTWTERGTKIPDTDSIQAFSGGAVVDSRNTAGFGTDAIVALYTGHHDDGTEDQRLAYSTDDGETFQKYENNPVIESNTGEFRDPNPFWYEPDESWRLVVSRVEATDDRPAGIEIYRSPNLLDWTYESTYVDEAGAGWECPSLFERPVEGADEARWVLPVSPIEHRSVEYHIGRFDGTAFVDEEVHSADHGYDFYATQQWGNEPADRDLLLTWMNNWEYAMEGPDPGWRGVMTVPRTLTLEADDNGLAVIQRPAEELVCARRDPVAELHSEPITPGRDPLDGTELAGRTLEIETTITPQSASTIGLAVRTGPEQESVISYDPTDGTLRFDRSNAGEFFGSNGTERETTAVELPPTDALDLRVLIDRCSVEIFAANGRHTMTNLVYPDRESTGVSLFAEDGVARVEELVAYTLSAE